MSRVLPKGVFAKVFSLKLFLFRACDTKTPAPGYQKRGSEIRVYLLLGQWRWLEPVPTASELSELF